VEIGTLYKNAVERASLNKLRNELNFSKKKSCCKFYVQCLLAVTAFTYQIFCHGVSALDSGLDCYQLMRK
jgi:hypothetical protein